MTSMTTAQKRRCFIRLRAQGITYRNIAAQINVATSTLVRWSRVYAVDIKNLEEIERQSFEDDFLIKQAASQKSSSRPAKQNRTGIA